MFCIVVTFPRNTCVVGRCLRYAAWLIAPIQMVVSGHQRSLVVVAGLFSMLHKALKCAFGEMGYFILAVGIA